MIAAEMAWNLRLPMPTRANNLVRPALIGKSARLVKTAAGKAFRDEAQALLRQHQAVNALPLLIGPVEVQVTFYFASISSDIDGPLKSLFDACKGIVWEDDRQICSMLVGKRMAGASVYEGCTFSACASDGTGDFAERLRAARERPKPPPRVKPPKSDKLAAAVRRALATPNFRSYR